MSTSSPTDMGTSIFGAIATLIHAATHERASYGIEYPRCRSGRTADRGAGRSRGARRRAAEDPVSTRNPAGVSRAPDLVDRHASDRDGGRPRALGRAAHRSRHLPGRLTSPDREIIPRLRALPPFDLVFDSRSRFMTVLLTRLDLKHRGYYACTPGFLLSDRPPPGRWMRPTGIAARMLDDGRGGDRPRRRLEGHVRGLARPRSSLPPRACRTARAMSGWRRAAARCRKNWPLERFIALATALAAKGYAPAFLIGPQEREWLATLRAAVPQALFPEAEPVDPALGIGRLEFAIALGRRLTADRRQRQRRRSSDGGDRHAAGEPVRPERCAALGAVRRALRHRARAGFWRRHDGRDPGRCGEQGGRAGVSDRSVDYSCPFGSARYSRTSPGWQSST